jgi:hypothetical protein
MAQTFKITINRESAGISTPEEVNDAAIFVLPLGSEEGTVLSEIPWSNVTHIMVPWSWTSFNEREPQREEVAGRWSCITP